MTTKFKIRPATEDDIPFILQGVRVIEERSYDVVPNMLTAERMKREIFCDKPQGHVLVGEVDDEYAGFIIFSFCYFASEGEGIWITNLYIDPFCRKSNLGRSMLNVLKNTYPHISGIYGAIAQSNTIARHFFSRVGAERYDDYRIYGSPIDTLESDHE